MAIDFPSAPATNDTYTYNGQTWVYNGTGWQGLGGGNIAAAADFGADNRVLRSDGTGKGAQASDIAVDDTTFAMYPTTNDVGTLGKSGNAWGDLFLASGGVINFNNGDVTVTHSANKLAVAGGVVDFDQTPTVNNVALAVVPTGSVLPYAGTTEPTGYLFCDGQAVSRTTYAALFTAISTTYGTGDGSTTFNLPDLRGRVVAGQDDMGGVSANRLTNQSGGLDGDTLGATGGSETHTLSTGELSSHSHTQQRMSTGSSANQPSVAATFNATPVSTGVSTQTSGSGTAHNNVQPTIILNYIIKT